MEVKLIGNNDTKKRTDIDDNYIMFPRELIEMKALFSLRLSVFAYLAKKRPLDDIVNMSINQLITFSGYIPDIHKNRTNDKFISVLDTLESLGYFEKITGDYIGNKICELQLDINKFENLKSFAYVTLKELKLINSYNSHLRNITPDKLLLVLSYIRVNKLRRSSNQQSNPKKKPEFFYRHINKIAEDLALSSKTVTACVTALESLDIIASCSMPRYQDKYGNWHTDVTLFVDKINDWQQELDWGKAFLLKGKTLDEDDGQSELTIEF